ncbi:MAG: hypothetical protein WCD79_05970 [Chthoniobacteraceae bacterium]
MAQKETYHLPGMKLEIDFSGDESHVADLEDSRPGLKRDFMQYLIKEGAVFEQADAGSNWKANGEADTLLEATVDSWIRLGKYKYKKSKDRQAKKIRWILACDDEVTILLEPE